MHTQQAHHFSKPLRIGLTGGIGSGKSTIAQLLVARGAGLIDADAISRQLTAPHGLAMPAIAATFGAVFVNSQGALDRERMRAHVFNQPMAKQQLEAIIHPLVSQEARRIAKAHVDAGCPALIFDIPLLVESGRWRSQLEQVWVVDCLAETQIQRVMARSQLSREAIQQIMAAQATRLQRLAAADLVIYNEGIAISALQTIVGSLPMTQS
jgi:dephospho-CoA kinase